MDSSSGADENERDALEDGEVDDWNEDANQVVTLGLSDTSSNSSIPMPRMTTHPQPILPDSNVDISSKPLPRSPSPKQYQRQIR